MYPTKGPGWHQPNNLPRYWQRVYGGRRVGHIIQHDDGTHTALHDGNIIGRGLTFADAQRLVDRKGEQ